MSFTMHGEKVDDVLAFIFVPADSVVRVRLAFRGKGVVSKDMVLEMHGSIFLAVGYEH